MRATGEGPTGPHRVWSRSATFSSSTKMDVVVERCPMKLPSILPSVLNAHGRTEIGRTPDPFALFSRSSKAAIAVCRSVERRCSLGAATRISRTNFFPVRLPEASHVLAGAIDQLSFTTDPACNAQIQCILSSYHFRSQRAGSAKEAVSPYSWSWGPV